MCMFQINPQIFVQSLKDAANYVNKDNPADVLGHVIFMVKPKQKKLSIIACDGHGYYERKVSINSKGKEENFCISQQDINQMIKFVPAKQSGLIAFEYSVNKSSGQLSAKLSLENGASTTFFVRTDFNLPDFKSICQRAEKGKKNLSSITSFLLPVHEMIRAGKAFTGITKKMAEFYISKGKDGGSMVLLEAQSPDDQINIKVIFMSAINETTVN